MKKELQDELRELFPELEDRKPEGFRVPYNYFEQLPDQVMQRIRLESDHSRQIQPGIRQIWSQRMAAVWAAIWQPRYAIGLAGVAMVLVAGVWFYTHQASEPEQTASLTQEEIGQYVSDHLTEFDEEQLVEQSLITHEAASEGKTLPLQEEEINQYLEQNLNDLDENELEKLL